MASLFHNLLYQPLYNAFIFLIDILPWLDVGVVVIVFTVIIKILLFPLSRKAVAAQVELRSIEPELNAIKEKYKDDKQEQARKTLDLYKQKKINPFSSILVILIQLPIILALYFVFSKAGLPALNENLLYSFIPRPTSIDLTFFGISDIAGRSVVLALLAGISSFFQIRFSMPALAPKKTGERSFGDDLTRSMNVQMRYVFPVIVAFISYTISGVIALYWTTSNLFTLAQEIWFKRQRKNSDSTGQLTTNN